MEKFGESGGIGESRLVAVGNLIDTEKERQQ
jgi:hypothetical protein